MLTRILVLAAAVCVIAGAPVYSLPEVTLTLKQVTLHEVLMKLSEQSNWQLSGPAGEGSADGVDRAKAMKARASFYWKNASLSTACNDVGRAFGLVALEDASHHVFFKPGPKPPTPIAATRVRGATLGVLEIARQEDYLLAAGSPKPRLEINTRMTIAVRRDDGDTDRIAAVEFLRAVDNLGITVPVGRMLFQPLTSEDRFGSGELVPLTQWVGAEDLLEIDPRAKKLVWLKGQVRFYERMRRLRVEVPLSAEPFPVEKQFGPLTIVVERLQFTPGEDLGMLTGKVRLTWAAHSFADNVIADDATAPWPAPKVKCRSSRLSILAALEDEGVRDGVTTYEMILNQRVRNSDPPVSLVWDLVHRSDPGSPIPFTLKNVPLPTGSYETLIGPTPGRKAPPAHRPASRPSPRR